MGFNNILLKIDTEEALRIGLVNAVAPDGDLMNHVIDLARRIMAEGQMAVRFSKATINNGIQADIDRAMTIECDIFALCSE